MDKRRLYVVRTDRLYDFIVISEPDSTRLSLTDGYASLGGCEGYSEYIIDYDIFVNRQPYDSLAIEIIDRYELTKKLKSFLEDSE